MGFVVKAFWQGSHAFALLFFLYSLFIHIENTVFKNKNKTIKSKKKL